MSVRVSFKIGGPMVLDDPAAILCLLRAAIETTYAAAYHERLYAALSVYIGSPCYRLKVGSVEIITETPNHLLRNVDVDALVQRFILDDLAAAERANNEPPTICFRCGAPYKGGLFCPECVEALALIG